MTRGRRKDMTIPPSRALLQQRDYRARKAQYVADLEERCRKAEAENAELQKEVDDLKRRLAQAPVGPSGVNSEMVSVCMLSTLVGSLQGSVAEIGTLRKLGLADVRLFFARNG